MDNEKKSRSEKNLNLQVSLTDKEIKAPLKLFDRGHKKELYISRALWTRPYGFYLKSLCSYKEVDYILEVKMTRSVTIPTQDKPAEKHD